MIGSSSAGPIRQLDGKSNGSIREFHFPLSPYEWGEGGS
jgi:hypothetical protein